MNSKKRISKAIKRNSCNIWPRKLSFLQGTFLCVSTNMSTRILISYIEDFLKILNLRKPRKFLRTLQGVIFIARVVPVLLRKLIKPIDFVQFLFVTSSNLFRIMELNLLKPNRNVCQTSTRKRMTKNPTRERESFCLASIMKNFPLAF